MTLSKKDRDELIKYRLDQAKECLDEVTFQIDNKKYKTAINRIYYGIFYSLLALGLKYEFETSKHFQLIGWFNKTFIRTGKVDIEIGKIVNKSYTLRQESDYEPFMTYEKPEVKELFERMKLFICAIEKILHEDK
ncbi:MAG: HEPN domain-containing protein [Bacteroidetes bacterium]|nr:HEPN domain-containing protein [Bacteroidota bacterium]